MLTKKQRDLLVYIHDYTQRTGHSPSFEEMKEGLDLKSKSGIHRLINALVERGFLQRLPNKARALEVLRLPDQSAMTSTAATAAAHVIRVAPRPTPKGLSATGNVRHAPLPAGAMGGMMAAASEIVSVPLHGKIAAGTPIEALRPDYDTVDIPAHMLGAQECYALTVEGDSMMKAGIMDGDVVIIESCNRANDGDIVVALVDGEEVTLKRLRREIGSVVLMPENDSYQPIRLSPDRVRIQGKLRSLFRNY